MIPARNDHFNAAASAAAPTQRDIYPSARNSESGDLRCDPDSPDQEPQTDDRLGYPNRQSADTPKQIRGLWGEKASRNNASDLLRFSYAAMSGLYARTSESDLAAW